MRPYLVVKRVLDVFFCRYTFNSFTSNYVFMREESLKNNKPLADMGRMKRGGTFLRESSFDELPLAVVSGTICGQVG
jgi:lipopolysaccharide/colanic/teichoic acid biosynthesis glycosyltransferase